MVENLNIFERAELAAIFRCVMANPDDSALYKAKHEELKVLTDRAVREGRLEKNIYNAMLTAFIHNTWMFSKGKELKSIEVAEPRYPFGPDEVKIWQLEDDLGL
ncbi:hypothetical protein [Pseudomonas canadensis]|uniref:hypothetical protein n=1 Tax=Pseudomonas canadensis TaxID=915099 RepID=UPI00273378BD|nr:hypothetical protein [Pseudomonas canadensis]WLH32649.1 hypothetical protein PSH56_13265 [Pseudomonas canadensis]